MGYTPVTPFRRLVDVAHLKHQRIAEKAPPTCGVNKWEALRSLSTARVTFDLSDRDMTVLQALLTFLPTATLGGNSADFVVYPSNRAICERLNGMPCSTMRRHLAQLIKAGVIVRRDSPNGKRFARKVGEDSYAYGFDLTPLAVRFSEFCQAAEVIRAEAGRLQRLREAVSLMRRDLAGLTQYGEQVLPDASIWANLNDLTTSVARALRRNSGWTISRQSRQSFDRL